MNGIQYATKRAAKLKHEIGLMEMELKENQKSSLIIFIDRKKHVLKNYTDYLDKKAEK